MYDTSGKYVRTHRYNPKVEDSIAVYCTHVETGEELEFDNIASAAEAFDISTADILEALYNSTTSKDHTWGWLI